MLTRSMPGPGALALPPDLRRRVAALAILLGVAGTVVLAAAGASPAGLAVPLSLGALVALALWPLPAADGALAFAMLATLPLLPPVGLPNLPVGAGVIAIAALRLALASRTAPSRRAVAVLCVTWGLLLAGALLSHWPAISIWLRPVSLLLIGAVASGVGLLAWLDEDRRVRWIDGLTAGLLVISASALVVFALQYVAPIPAIVDGMSGVLAFLRGEGAAAKFDSGNNWLIWGEGVTLRAVSPLVPSPNNLGGVVGLLLPFAAVRWLTATPGKARGLAAAAVLLSITAVLVTYSRSTWVGIGIAGLGALAIVIGARLHREPAWPSVSRLAAVIALAVAALGIGYAGVVTAGHQEVEDRITRPFEDPSVTTRIDMDQQAVDAVVADPLRGAGLGNWSATIPEHGQRGYIHNVYLEYGAATGLFGLAWTIALVLVPLAGGLRLARQRTAGSARLYGAALATAALFAAAQFMFEDNLLNPQYAWSQCLLLGMGAAAWRPRAE